MFHQGIKGVDFIITNTDAQALTESGVPTKIQLGASLTEEAGFVAQMPSSFASCESRPYVDRCRRVCWSA